MKWMCLLTTLAAVVANPLLAASPHGAPVRDASMGNASSLVAPTLRSFRSLRDFENYREELRRIARERGAYWARSSHIVAKGSVLLAQATPRPCDPAIEDCPALEEVVTTARKRTSASITNNQEAGVDEGDIVKTFGRFLIVLQHGRLFSIDTGEAGGELRIVDRVDAYAGVDSDAWYDELLIRGNTLLVTGYSYKEERSELSLFLIGPDGRLRLSGRVFIRSEDYYSGGNYATRLVDDNLVIYSAVDITGYDRGQLPPLPMIQRWSPGRGHSRWEPLFRITDVFRPIQFTLEPQIHAVSVCPIRAGRLLACRTRAIVGPWQREMYVSNRNAYLWIPDELARWERGGTTWRRCEDGEMPPAGPSRAAAVFRFPIGTRPVAAARAHGVPDSQFAFDERDEALLAVVERQPATCHPTDTADPPLEFSTIPERAFSNGPWLASRAVGALLPAPPGGREGGLQLQYTDRFVVYGGAQGAWRAMWPRYRGPFEASGVVVVPIASPTDAAILPLLHSVERLELLGRNAVAFGYSNERDFEASTIRLGPRAEVASTVSLPGVGTSEGRSHAFNALVGPNDVGMFGLPTIRWEEFERHSGEPREFVDFFGVDSAAHATSVGALVASGQNVDASYECAVSCIDWYGNARPIFFRGRVFALIGLTAIEGVLRNGQMSTLAELNLTSPIGTNAVTPRYD